MNLIKLIASLVIVFAAAAIGSAATIPNIETWYAFLEKPFFNPPNWLFGPVWTLLYTLIAIAFYLVWVSKAKGSKNKAFVIFGIQLTLNTLWSIMFFGLHQTWLALLVILGLHLSIFLTIRAFYPFSRVASYLLIPYILWVSFAFCLNIGIALLNG